MKSLKWISLALTFQIVFTTCSNNDDDPNTFTLSVSVSPEAGGTVSTSGGNYDEGTNVSISATAADGFEFRDWTGSVQSTSNPVNVTMDSNKSITANFVIDDLDGDGVPNASDECDNTPSGVEIDEDGCTLYVFLDSNGVTVKAYDYATAGDSSELDGTTYTVVDETMLRNMIANSQDVSNVCTTNVTDMSSLFSNESSFNQSLESWDVSNVTDMTEMFSGATSYNQEIGSWDVSNVVSMASMFQNASAFNGDIESWDVRKVIIMDDMFRGASSFNQDIGSWDMSGVDAIRSMFSAASSFNQDIGSWNISGVADLSGIFNNASAFNQDISSWDVSNATLMAFMFSNTSAFNQDISSWDVGNVTSMDNMFNNATGFNQDLSSWDVIDVIFCADFATGTPQWILAQPNFTNCTP